MAESKNKAREAREARERLKLYNARQEVHGTQVRRRRRDNVIAIVSVLVVAVLAALTQFFYFSAGPGAPTATPSASASAAAGANVGDIPDPSVAQDRTWTGTLTLNKIALGVSLDGAAAPQAVASVITDIQNGYYDGKTCHRLVDTDVTTNTPELIQCGSLDGTGAGDTSYQFGPVENAPADNVYKTGVIAMARSTSEYSQDHQFFIMFSDATLGSAPGYTVIGTATSGLDTLAKSTIVTGGLTPTGTDPNDGIPKTATTITGFTIK